jgi:hypothetical protein
MDAVANQPLWFGLAGVLAVLLGVIAAYNLYRSKPHEAIPNQQDSWTPTGRIDFSDFQSTGNFVLQAEDTRIANSIGGIEHREIRWRKATLDEAKTVVVAYHVQRNLAVTANYVVSSRAMLRPGSDPKDEHQEAQSGRTRLLMESPQARHVL